MLQDYLDKLSQSRQAHPISEGDYEAFKASPIFKRLLNDLEESVLSMMDDIGSHDSVDMNAMRAVRFNETKCSLEFVQDWLPEELSIDESD